MFTQVTYQLFFMMVLGGVTLLDQIWHFILLLFLLLLVQVLLAKCSLCFRSWTAVLIGPLFFFVSLVNTTDKTGNNGMEREKELKGGKERNNDSKKKKKTQIRSFQFWTQLHRRNYYKLHILSCNMNLKRIYIYRLGQRSTILVSRQVGFVPSLPFSELSLVSGV